MAVCGHCWVCGYKFDCIEGEALEVGCSYCEPVPDPDREYGSTAVVVRPHKVCRACHDVIEGVSGEDDARELLAMLVRLRSARAREHLDARAVAAGGTSQPRQFGYYVGPDLGRQSMGAGEDERRRCQCGQVWLLRDELCGACLWTWHI